MTKRLTPADHDERGRWARNSTLSSALAMIEEGETPEAIVRALGIKPDSVGQALHRAGHDEAARPFWRLAQRKA